MIIHLPSRALAEDRDEETEAPSGGKRGRLMKALRVYIDTSVVGGCEDDVFRDASCTFFEEVGKGRFWLLVSDLLVEE